ncbi:MAG: serine/threonine protein kinase [Nitrososphaerota archaeon]|nr:serine/threonine protein kinase [Nitrososphaerota archaeon]
MQATHSERATLEQVVRTPYVQILTYPKISLRSARSRVRQLERLGVESLTFEGRAKIGRLGLLGIGTVGVVVKCTSGGEDYALKIRRTDANRPSLAVEYELTSFANRLGVGATVYGHTKDFLLLKLLDYVEFSDWIRELSGEGTRARARGMVHEVLNQCRKLDIMGLDHGQLSNLRKHVVVAEGRLWIIDFESASRSRRPSNVTSAAQYLLVGGKISPLMRRLLGVKNTEPVLTLLRDYKKALSDIAYSRLLEYLKLAPS